MSNPNHTLEARAKRRGLSKTTLQYHELKKSILNKYGSKCARCGFSDWRALQLDHVNNNGAEDREESRDGNGVYNSALKDKDGEFQLLCANCNSIKRLEDLGYLDSTVPYRRA
jgi:hypothetical protein